MKTWDPWHPLAPAWVQQVNPCRAGQTDNTGVLRGSVTSPLLGCPLLPPRARGQGVPSGEGWLRSGTGERGFIQGTARGSGLSLWFPGRSVQCASVLASGAGRMKLLEARLQGAGSATPQEQVVTFIPGSPDTASGGCQCLVLCTARQTPTCTQSGGCQCLVFCRARRTLTSSQSCERQCLVLCRVASAPSDVMGDVTRIQCPHFLLGQ
ncbi:hypothetical protein NDU88_000028 [Pleurodeles waltl]|uniref:Uncharacterized protein n=1 Tax=Pleurodeles waltl TaxID=8319 RepID=A0AAV7MHL7_PLEWA|nr:hypothetical protein NDU88_000028 [Pleurodeles waltl]